MLASPLPALEGFSHLLQGTLSQPAPVLIAAVLLIGMLIAKARAGRPTRTDPSRLFSATQRREGFARASDRCELERWPFSRCKRSAHHGDHYIPWSKGGSTSMANFVAACARCNTSKGAKMPGAWSRMRLEARRRKYFAPGSVVRAGERFAQR